jgi:DNA-binding protein HU-beta
MQQEIMIGPPGAGKTMLANRIPTILHDLSFEKSIEVSRSFSVIGPLVLAKHKARIGCNPATGEAIKIPAKTVVKMRIAKAAKEAIVPKKK